LEIASRGGLGHPPHEQCHFRPWCEGRDLLLDLAPRPVSRRTERGLMVARCEARMR
jgi:hypothetical protein